MKKINISIFILILFTSCSSDIFFTSPQPGFAEDLSEVPQEFQGTFADYGSYYVNEQGDTISPDTTIHVLTDVTINGDTINNGDLIVKSWGKYCFVNNKTENGTWALKILHLQKMMSHEIISAQSVHTSVVDLTGFDFVEDTASSTYTLDDVSVLQFHYLLRMSHKNKKEIERLK